MSSTSAAASAASPELPGEGSVCVRRTRSIDADELGAATRQADVDLSVVRGPYRGTLLDLETEDFGIEWGFHAVPVFVQGPTWGDGAFLARWGGRGCSRANGEMLGSGVMYYPPGAEHQSLTEGPVGWVSIRVPALGAHAAALAPEVDLSPGSRVRHVERAPEAIEVLEGLLRDARRAAEAGAEALRDPAARRGLRELLATALVRIVAADRPQRTRESIAFCSSLVRRAEESLRARSFQPVYVPELCATLGASEARLREAFQRVCGVGPTRYLRLRRLHLVRRALRSTRAEELTVSAAAARFGFFELGRFAGDYRALFGELPSRTRRAR